MKVKVLSGRYIIDQSARAFSPQDWLMATYSEDAESAEGVWIITNEDIHRAASGLFLEGAVEHRMIQLSDCIQGYQHFE